VVAKVSVEGESVALPEETHEDEIFKVTGLLLFTPVTPMLMADEP
jgi:hypothetical protein